MNKTLTFILKRDILIGFVISFLFSSSVKGQESMMNDVSYVYMEKLVAAALENYPRLKTNESRINIAEHNISKAKMGWLTPLSVSYVYSPDNNLNITNPTFFSGYQVGVFLNIGTILQTPANVKVSREELKIARSENEEYKLTLSTEVKRRYLAYIQAMKTVQISSKAAIDAQNNVTEMKYKYNRGETGLNEYSNTLDRLRVQNLAKIEAEGTLLIAKASLEELLGLKLEEIK